MNKPVPNPVTLAHIKKVLPHRAPILLPEKAYNWTPETLTAVMTVKADSRWFKGHFPGQPTLPGVVMVEAMAQTAALHVGLANQYDAEKTIYYFLSIENTRFRQPITKPGLLVLDVRQENRKGDYYKYSGKVYVDADPTSAERSPRQLVADAQFMAKLVRIKDDTK